MYGGVPMTAPIIVAICVPSSADVRAHRARDAEVGDQRDAVDDQDVLGLDVAVHDVLLVRVAERGGDLTGEPQRVLDRQLRLAPQPRAERLARDVRHHVVEEAAGCPRIEQRHDVRMIQPRGDLDLAQEPLAADRRGISGFSTLIATCGRCLRSSAR